jgi:Tat protein translocase TatB subunit
VIDVGLFELIIISLAGLIIVGPKRLPVLFRTLGALLAKAKSYISEVKSEIESEINFEELKSTEKEIKKLGENYTKDIVDIQNEIETLSQNSSLNIFEEKEKDKFGFFITSKTLSWEQENFEHKIRDRVRRRLRKRFFKKKCLDD